MPAEPPPGASPAAAPSHARVRPQDQTEGPDALGARPAVAIEPAPLSWLWPGRLAAGKLALIVGDPDTGKSLLALDIAARLSHGRPWPDGSPCPKGRTLIISAEDGVEDTIRPRLGAAGADMARIHIIDGGLLILRRDMVRLARWLQVHRDCRLVILDPLPSFIRGTSNAAVRAALDPLAMIAASSGTAVLGIVHLNKNDRGRALYRASGALAFVAAARQVQLVSRAADDPERRLVTRVKNNLSDEAAGMAFRVARAGNGQPAIAWEPEPLAIGAAQALAATAADADEAGGRETDEWLASALAAGPQPSRDLRRLASSEGFAWRTVKRAKVRLGIRASRDGFGPGSLWYWQLPGDRGQRSEDR